eukprot:s99_g30.t1
MSRLAVSTAKCHPAHCLCWTRFQIYAVTAFDLHRPAVTYSAEFEAATQVSPSGIISPPGGPFHKECLAMLERKRYAFGSLPRAILTLVQFVSLDSIAGVYFPLIMAKPWLAIYFMPLMVLIPIGLMNLVTAVLVEHALSHATREEELHRMHTKDTCQNCFPQQNF